MPSGMLQSVLYVDDDPDISEVVDTTLRLIGGLVVHKAGSGEAAIDMAHELQPDVILMDVMMPGLDGPATVRRLRENTLTAGIPVIFMTAKVMPEEVSQLLKSGAIGVIGKPFEPLGLSDEIHALWKKRHTTQTIGTVPSAEAQLQTRVESLLDSFLRRTIVDVDRMREMLDRVRRGETSALLEIERVGHSIHGAGAMFGFPHLSAIGGAIEHLAEERTASNGGPSGPDVLQQLAACIAQLAQDLAAATDTTLKSAAMHQV
jgi:two-component system, OmpR family, response regulator